ncbi:acetyl esterase/lipase [Kribbella sp. VKM Ac-2527]|uniref:Acetyl esterase/lipase n=1 Tax=Kribbella caucasensis TaxID=2512215 RepID=A0A4R6KJT5_9ACTN|nr:alpha/beta hydrolase [Kribbella sp. VKM Ac-2527]TDO51574.1 acetyl esterase/lipase [Kribbella sp. VKM Ac-2527]
MPFSLDPEVAAGLETLSERIGEVEPMPVGDVMARRAVYDELQRVIHGMPPVPDDVTITDYKTSTEEGAQLLLRWYAKDNATPGSAVLYLHGGGMCLSSVEIYDAPVMRYVSATGVPFLSVEYRYAPEFPAPTPVIDCYRGLQWLVEHAATLGIDPQRVAIMGDSSGGGVAASLAIYARDQGGPAIAKQILVYPMLDDRNTTPDPLLTPFAPWTYDDNITGWTALLGSAVGRPDVSPYGAAARLRDFSGLPPAYIEVGELDIFRDESIDYARKLFSAGVSTELHIYPKVAHAFEAFVPDAAISKQAIENRTRAVRSL